ncbi:xanthine dehydrogenase family protein [bacterium]|nr:xanthine dehydrogenase family protein [bacterium]
MVGKYTGRVDAYGKVTGKAKYAADIKYPGMLYGSVLRSSHTHAVILRIDTSRAIAQPGVKAVLTAQDIPGAKFFGVVTKNQYVLADDKVRYLGDGVALIAATDNTTARKALDLIEVQYEELPAVFDPEEAMKPNAPKIHGKDNTFVHHKCRKGNVEAGFKKADIVLEREYRTPRIEHSYIEPEAAVAVPLDNGGVRIECCAQNMYSTRRSAGEVLALPLNKVEIVQATMGGSFGGKDEVLTSLCCRAALLALKTGKPVKMVNSREESFLESYKRHAYILRYKLGAKKTGEITAIEAKIIADGGAYASMSPFVTWRSTVQATGPYNCPNVKTDAHAVYTNQAYTGAMRGFGSPQVNFAIESLMDELAEEVRMDPLELRMKNAFVDGSITATGQKLNPVVSLKECLKKATDEMNWKEKRVSFLKEREGSNPIKRGIGLACSYRGVALGAEGVDAAATVVSVQTDGSVIMWSGICDMGQGAQTAQSIIAAEVLGISPKRLVFMSGNTSRISDSGPTVASRGTIMGGSAAKKAAETVRDSMLSAASEILDETPDNLIMKDDQVFSQINENKKISFSKLAEECFRKGLKLFGFGWHKGEKTTWDEEAGQGIAYFTYVYGCNVAEVEVDTETGKVNVVRTCSAHDVGRAVNRAGVEGQIFGGVAMGMGYGLLEDYGIQDGKPECENFDEYLLPTACDVPEMKAVIVENPDPLGPFGAKSIGEPATEIMAPAILNAICHATGKRIRELPANLEQVLLGHKLKKS